MTSDVAVLYLTHVYDAAVAVEYERLKRECEPACDVRLVYDASCSGARSARKAPNSFGFRPKQIIQQHGLHMPESEAQTLWPGGSDLIVMTYSLAQPTYQFYWLIEYDVRFTGPWRGLFDAFADSDADLLGTMIYRYVDLPDWRWWPSLSAPDGDLQEQDRLRSFLPVYRISNRALRLMQTAYEQGWQGHYEATIPTVLNKHGYGIEDIGGTGPFVAPKNVERFYTSTPTEDNLSPGTFVWRPLMDEPGDLPNMLWHPVKPRRKGFWRRSRR